MTLVRAKVSFLILINSIHFLLSRPGAAAKFKEQFPYDPKLEGSNLVLLSGSRSELLKIEKCLIFNIVASNCQNTPDNTKVVSPSS
jgi:hypothetical protein